MEVLEEVVEIMQRQVLELQIKDLVVEQLHQVEVAEVLEKLVILMALLLVEMV